MFFHAHLFSNENSTSQILDNEKTFITDSYLKNTIVEEDHDNTGNVERR